ncbi:TetR/AcrR family transcriptional regulator [Gemmatimonas groenlandica]|uniref:TetR/AcrR family transcriptional regulator n=1 Tax=Gemmatimonas groenlandica TaxID=2732249 RepID=A0A6M4IX59_9BACT|nr:TetR/AcrR family transcriptional regulator [Gemmatimonas groenlandica]QJR37482.1 TetR/AcrR family transcriptional regulator [Gemmatimonas groenlandica]
MPRKPAASAYHHGDLRRSLLAVAFDILKTKGPEALSLREVARAASVSHQAPYHHFPSRQHLLAALATEGFDDLASRLDEAQRQTQNLETIGQATGVAYVLFAAQNPERFRLMFGGEIGSRAPYPELVDASQRVFALLRRPFGTPPGSRPGRDDDGQVDQHPPASVVANVTAGQNPVVLTLWSTVHGLASLVVDGQVVLSGDALERAALATTQMVWLGVKQTLASAPTSVPTQQSRRPPS